MTEKCMYNFFVKLPECRKKAIEEIMKMGCIDKVWNLFAKYICLAVYCKERLSVHKSEGRVRS